MVKIYKKTEVVQFGEMIQQFKIVSPVKVLELKYKDEDIEIDRYTIDDGMNLIYVIEVYQLPTTKSSGFPLNNLL